MTNQTKHCFQALIPTPQGTFIATYSSNGLRRLAFPSSTGSAARAAEAKLPAEVRGWHALTIACVNEVLSGRACRRLPPLDLAAGTEFQKRVWDALRRIGPGETRSYAAVAQAIGRPKAARAVGAACGANPIPLLIPCHRVLAANKKLGGFSGGLRWKRLLLGGEQSWFA